jgi:hypothetical protein
MGYLDYVRILRFSLGTLAHRHLPMSGEGRRRYRLASIATLLIGLMLSGPALALAQTTSLTGVVTDPQGGVVVGAEVSLAEPRAATATTRTDAEGRYSFAGLKSGSYQLRVTVRGFQTFARSVDIGEGRATTADVSLAIDSLAETTTVLGSGDRIKVVQNLGPLPTMKALDTPYTTYTITQEMLSDSMVADPFEVERITPLTGIDVVVRNLQFTFVGFRGVGGAIAINGIRQNSNYGYFMENAGAIQMLSGYSSFLYGIGSSGGLENYDLKRPTDRALTNVTVNDYETRGFNGSADISRQYHDGMFGIRVNAMRQDGGTSVNDQNWTKYLGSLAFDFKPTDRLQIMSDFYRGYSRLDGYQNGFFLRGSPNLLPNLDNSELWVPKSTFSDVNATFGSVAAKLKINKTFGIRAAWDIKNDDVKTITANHVVQPNATNTGPSTFYMTNSGGGTENLTNGGYA